MKSTAVTLKQLECLIAVDEMAHFRRAAEICGISQPALSQQIQNLELALNVQLVERSRSHVALTPIGRETVEHARRAVDTVRAIIDTAASAQDDLIGTIRLGTSPTIGPYLLPLVVAALHQRHQELRLHVRESPAHDLEFDLTKGVHDVIVTQLPISSQDHVAVPLFREPLFLAMAIDHPLAKQEKIDLKTIAGLDVLPLSPKYVLHDQVKSLCETYGATLRKDYEGTSLDALRQMAGMGMGVTFLPALYVNSEIRARSEVVAKPIKGRSVHRNIGLVWRKSATRFRAYEMLADLINETVKKRVKISESK